MAERVGLEPRGGAIITLKSLFRRALVAPH